MIHGVAVTVCLLGSVAVAHGASVPFGHADWRPTPTDPVGFAGQWNGWYPGATAPLVFGEGTVANMKVKVESKRRRDGYLSLSGPYEAERTAPVFTDSARRNIMWKSPTPGWSSSQPIVVGRCVITTHSPHHVVCWDADTGTVLWKDELKTMFLPTLAADRKTLTAAPDAQEAGRRQHLFELGLAVYRLGMACNPGLHKTILDTDDRKALIPLMAEVLKGLEGMRGEVEAACPEAIPALDAQMAEYRAGMTASTTSDQQAWRFRLDAFPQWVAKTTGVPLHNCWAGWQIGDTIATPVSDGDVVCIQFGHGQAAAYEVQTGRRLWAFRDPTVQATSASHAASPILWKDLVVFNAGGGPRQSPTLLAMDKRTGEIRWESPGGQGGCRMGRSHGDHMSHHLLRLPDGKGGIRALIVSNKGAVIDAETGKELAEKLPGGGERNEGSWGSGYIGSSGSLVFKTWGGDCTAPPCENWELKLTGPETLEIVTRPMIPFSNSHGPFAVSAQALVLQGKLIDPVSAKVLADVPKGTTSIVGTHMVIANDLVNANGRNRQDRMCLASFTIVDIADPANPTVVSRDNILGSAAMPADIMDKYFPSIASSPDLKALTLGGYHGVSAVFGVFMSGVTAHGDQLYIQSQSHLYCIGAK